MTGPDPSKAQNLFLNTDVENKHIDEGLSEFEKLLFVVITLGQLQAWAWFSMFML